MIQVFVKTLTGKTHTIDVEKHETVLDLKRKVHDRTEVLIIFQILIFRDKVLDRDNVMLWELGIVKDIP